MTSKEKQRSPKPNNPNSTNQEQLSTISIIREVRREEEAWKVPPRFMFFFMLAAQFIPREQSNASGAAVDLVSVRLTPLQADLEIKVKQTDKDTVRRIRRSWDDEDDEG